MRRTQLYAELYWNWTNHRGKAHEDALRAYWRTPYKEGIEWHSQHTYMT